MGRLRVRHNSKGRLKKDIQILEPKEKVEVVSDQLQQQRIDSCNALILPVKKRKTRDVTKKLKTVRILSKKERKRLEYIVQRKEKKDRRADLLESLKKVQGDPEILVKLQSVSGTQTRGLKRIQVAEKLRSVGGVKKIRRKTTHDSKPVAKDKTEGSLSVIGTEVELSDSDDDESSSEPNPESDSNPATAVDDAAITETAAVKGVTGAVVEEKTAAEGGENKQTATTAAAAAAAAAAIPAQSAPDPGELLGLEYTAVHRSAAVQQARLELPILGEEQRIVEAVRQNRIVVLAGETGSGKTTQVPQFLYEAGYARHKRIGVTEPRRVAAISMSQRVAHEMNVGPDVVSYQIRFQGNATAATRIKFMTDGVLLKELESDFLLSDYSVIVLDEAHERSVFTDILVGLLSRVVVVREKRRQPLRLIIMSATLRVQDFTDNARLFAVPPPVIRVESRQYPVTVHWNRRTGDNYVAEAFRKACKIHATLPAGGILVFVTGQKEVNGLVRRLRRRFPLNTSGQHDTALKKQTTSARSTSQTKDGPGQQQQQQEESRPISHDECEGDHGGGASDDDDDLPELGVRRGRRRGHRAKSVSLQLPDIKLDTYSLLPPCEQSEDLLEAAGGADDDSDDEDCEEDDVSCSQPMDVRPLYAMLPTSQQSLVFLPPVDGARLCVVSTNVAETSLTIPGVRYVIDSGRVKQKVFDTTTGVSAFRVMWESQAAANQRAGRAGRLGAGHCYRLFSSAVFQHELVEFTPPEIQRRPVADVLLQMRAMGIDRVANFPFPSPPDQQQLTAAEQQLLLLGALESATAFSAAATSTTSSSTATTTRARTGTLITPLGRVMASFPVAPRYAKMLALSRQHSLLPYTVCLVAALSVPQLLLTERPDGGGCGGTAGASASTTNWLAGVGYESRLLGDAMVLLRVVGAVDFAGGAADFCRHHQIRPAAVREIRQLRAQLGTEVSAVFASSSKSQPSGTDAAPAVDALLKPPSQLQCRLLRQLLLAALPDHVAERVDPSGLSTEQLRTRWKHAYRCTLTDQPVFLHPSSTLRRLRPRYVVFQELHQTGRHYMRCVTAVEPDWLPRYCRSLCHCSEPLAEPPPHYDPATGRVMCHVTITFGPAHWPLPAPVAVEYPAGGSGGVQLYRQFAVHVLSGDVAPPLVQFSSALLAPAQIMTRNWARLQPRTEALLQALCTARVDNGPALFEQWRRDPQFLLTAYLQWLPEVLHDKVQRMWPPLDTPSSS